MRAYLGLGSNLGDRAANLAFARSRLGAEGVQVMAESAVEETEPVGGVEQPKFLNQVIEVDTDLTPRKLLEKCKSIEARAGRRPDAKRWGPRILDIDILLYGHLTVDTPDLQIPHPQLVSREFVLRELRQINPRFTDAVSGVTTEQLVQQLLRDDEAALR